MHRALEATGTTNGIAPGPEWKIVKIVCITAYVWPGGDGGDDDAYTDTKAVLMMLIAIMIVGMRDGVNIEKDDDDSDDRSL